MATGRDTNDAILLIDGVIETCNISPSFQNVYFKFEVVEGKFYEFRCFSDGDTYGHLYNKTGQEIASDDDSGGGYDPLINYLADYTGIVYFRVRAYSSSSTINNVAVSAKELSIDISQGTNFGNAIEIPDDGTVLDQQLNSSFPYVYFKFNIVPDATYVFQTFGNIDLVAHLYDQNRQEILNDDDSGEGNNPLLTYRSTEHGILYVGVRPYRQGAGGSFQAQLFKIDTPPRPGDSFDNSIPIELNTKVEGSFLPFYQEMHYLASLTVRKDYTVRINKDYVVDFWVDTGESFRYLEYNSIDEVGNYLIYSFTATFPNIYIIAQSPEFPTENGFPFELFLEEADPNKVASVYINPSSATVKVGVDVQLRAEIYPPTAIDKSVTWESSHPEIASVDATGLVTGISAGSTTIYATTNDGGYTEFSYITVRAFNGSGTKNDPFLVSNVEELQNVMTHRTSHFKQTQNIDLSSVEKWIPIGNDTEFRGVYDGNGYTISNLRSVEDITLLYANSSIKHFGLFGYVRNATLKNITIDSAEILMRGNYIGTLAAYVNGTSTIENCIVINSNIISYLASVGGLIGAVDSGSNITFCHVIDCTFKSSKDWTEENRQYLSAAETGGLIGRLSNSNDAVSVVRQCSATKNHFEPFNIYYSLPKFGGLIGFFNYIWEIKDCFATGNLKAPVHHDKDDSGGIAGYGVPSRIKNCYASFSYEGTTTSFLPRPPSDKNMGGIIGEVYNSEQGAATNTYFDSTVFNDIDSIRGTPRTTAQLYRQSTFVDWDFENVWQIEEGLSYPTLREKPPSTIITSEGYSRAVRLSSLVFKRMREPWQ